MQFINHDLYALIPKGIGKEPQGLHQTRKLKIKHLELQGPQKTIIFHTFSTS
jgi:hypothetical protein